MEWIISQGLTVYPHALEVMAARVAAIQQGDADELVWLVEHPPLYTLGTSAKASDVRAEVRGHNNPSIVSPVPSFPIYETGRGGQVTYHGPGQRVVYLMRDLKKYAGEKGPDLRAYVKQLEQWIILTLQHVGIEGFIREGRVGVWVDTPRGEAKIAALGVRVQKWVTSHGIAINVHPDLSHYAGIVPCGIREFGVTSMRALGVDVGMDEVDAALKEKFSEVFISKT